MPPLISICIPTYKNVVFLQRLLHSIAAQTFTDFEVIVTDDSSDHSVAECVQGGKWSFPLTYFKNETSLGSPENWNEAVNRATGQWIKIMHHDDWFACSTSLQRFASLAKEKPGFDFFYCPYNNVYENGASKTINPPSQLLRSFIFKNPAALLAGNIIGPPSVTMYRNNKVINYDKRLKWLVDIDFYIRFLKKSSSFFINEQLVNIGIHKSQITKESFGRREIEIPEHLIVLEKIGEKSFNSPIVYDAFWRLIRNLQIASIGDLNTYSPSTLPIPGRLKLMLKHQSIVPKTLLKIGAVSKITMLVSWLINKR